MSNVSIKNLVLRKNLTDVFTPSTVAKLTYIKRKEVETQFRKNLSIPGTQMCIYGNSGSGKTTLTFKILSELKIRYIKNSCTIETTYNQLLIDAFDQIGIFYTTEKAFTKKNSIKVDIKRKFIEIESAIKSESSLERSTKKNRVVPIQLTPQRLSEFLGAINCIWVIEDFHKMKEMEKTKVSQILKVFMDTAKDYEKCKVICIGAVATARELIKYDNELNNRVAEIFIPLMRDDEINQIIEKGFKILNVRCKERSIIDKISHYSNNLASVCHQLCFDICYNRNIRKSSFKPIIVNLEDFNSAVRSFLNKFSDTFNMYYEKICTKSKYKQYLNDIIDLNKEMFNREDSLENKNIPMDKLIEQ